MKIPACMKSVFIGLIVLAASLSHATDTTTEEEHRVLIQVVRELDQVKTLMQKAQAQSDPNARRVFYYSAFEKDLNEMRKALVQHLEKPARSPRKIQPLRTTSDR